jgi:TRAP-type C4-dicarboxylate transport system substrate-binding protein
MKLIAIAVAVAPVAMAGATQAADPYVVKVAYTAPPTSPTWTKYWGAWTDKVNKDSDGTIDIQPFHGGRLANMANMYDRLTKGVFEVGYGLQAMVGGKFPKTAVSELPFLAAYGRDAAAALWRLHEQGLLGDEYAEVHPISLYVYPQIGLQLNKPVKTLEDMKGIKLSVSGKVAADIMQSLDAVAVAMGPADIYQAASRGVIDGAAMQWTGVLQFKIHEVTKYHLNVQLGSSAGYMLMNKDAYAKLPAKGRSALDANSGYAVSRAFGATLDDIAEEQYATVSKMSGHTMASLEAKELDRWIARVTPLIDEWAKATPNGAKILAAFKSEVAKSAAMK